MIFIQDNTIQQPPAFLYATYPNEVYVSGSYPLDPTDNPGDVLVADELDGFSFTMGPEERRLGFSFPAPYQLEYFAIAGRALNGVVVEVRGSEDVFASSDVQISPPTALNGSISAWCRFPSVSYKYLKYIFTNFSSNFRVKHLAAGCLSPLPYFADGACFAPLQVEGDHLISYEGLILGSKTQRATRPFNLSFGGAMPVEEAVFSAAMEACHKKFQGLFLVPDISQPAAYFGYIDKKYVYKPAMKTGSYIIPPIPFVARAS